LSQYFDVLQGIAVPRNTLNKHSSIKHLRGHGLLQCSAAKSRKVDSQQPPKWPPNSAPIGWQSR
jgi:hypothetical protein